MRELDLLSTGNNSTKKNRGSYGLQAWNKVGKGAYQPTGHIYTNIRVKQKESEGGGGRESSSNGASVLRQH